MCDLRTWQDCADEYRQLSRGEGWPYARLIACSVERSKGGRPPKENPVDRPGNPDEKVSASEFAERAGTTHNRVLRFLDAWERAAARDHVPFARLLKPKDAWVVSDPSIPWKVTEANEDGEVGVYSAAVTKEIKPAQIVAAMTDPEVRAQVVKEMDFEQREEVSLAFSEDLPPKKRRPREPVEEVVLTDDEMQAAADAQAAQWEYEAEMAIRALARGGYQDALAAIADLVTSLIDDGQEHDLDAELAEMIRE